MHDFVHFDEECSSGSEEVMGKTGTLNKYFILLGGIYLWFKNPSYEIFYPTNVFQNHW